MIKSIIGAVLATAVMTSPILVRAAESGGAPVATSPEKPARARQMPFRGKVEAVDVDARTVSLKGREKSRVFHVTPQTRIRRDGEPAELDSLRVGETVGGLARANAKDQWEIVTLNIGKKPNETAGGKAEAEPSE